ncbi:methyltransferase domain-containing protein [Niabella beijingensis]|uniref:methyltransferase domain-containing protein n=1 Tax=Niabella beijingensis TaxID=2872700 RepID=UPI001CBC8F65|nr:methyltransferase domain-containing protein [Niabella beijingensis]
MQPQTKAYDIGCPTGTTLKQMSKLMPENVSLVGIDDSEEMIVKCREKLDSLTLGIEIELNMVDITKDVPVQQVSVVTMVLVLQFARPINRLEVVKRYSMGLSKTGRLSSSKKSGCWK